LEPFYRFPECFGSRAIDRCNCLKGPPCFLLPPVGHVCSFNREVGQAGVAGFMYFRSPAPEKRVCFLAELFGWKSVKTAKTGIGLRPNVYPPM